jgi:ABC-type uncharacterized transport system permease subunit
MHHYKQHDVALMENAFVHVGIVVMIYACLKVVNSALMSRGFLEIKLASNELILHFCMGISSQGGCWVKAFCAASKLK